MFGIGEGGYPLHVSRNVRVTTNDGTGDFVGAPICEGPGVYRLMLTWPFKAEGQIIEIPLEDIDAVTPVAVDVLGETPKVLS